MMRTTKPIASPQPSLLFAPGCLAVFVFICSPFSASLPTGLRLTHGVRPVGWSRVFEPLFLAKTPRSQKGPLRFGPVSCSGVRVSIHTRPQSREARRPPVRKNALVVTLHLPGQALIRLLFDMCYISTTIFSYSAWEPIQNHTIAPSIFKSKARQPMPTRIEYAGRRLPTSLNWRPGLDSLSTFCSSFAQGAGFGLVGGVLSMHVLVHVLRTRHLLLGLDCDGRSFAST